MRCRLALCGALAVALALATFASPLRASVAVISLKELIDGSDLIVVARVSKVEDGPANLERRDPDADAVKVATAQVVETWKGTSPRDVRYIASATWVCDISDAEVGERTVLFLRKAKGSPFMTIAHSGRGRMPLRDVTGKPYATIWDDVRLPDGVTTIPGPEPRYSFIRSVDLSELSRLVKSKGR